MMTVVAVLLLVCSIQVSGYQNIPLKRIKIISQRLNVATVPTESKWEEVTPQKFTSVDFIRLAREFVANPSADRLAEDSIYRGPLIGPIAKKDYFNVLKTVAGTQDIAFPDRELNAFGFTCDDPIEPTRVWYFMRERATFSGPFQIPAGITIQPTGKKFIGPPEARSFIFNDDGKIKHFSAGYVADRFTGDTTNGLGAVFGKYEVIGVPLAKLGFGQVGNNGVCKA
jgi:hypothetical protein